jgi:hypothetical protein
VRIGGSQSACLSSSKGCSIVGLLSGITELTSKNGDYVFPKSLIVVTTLEWKEKMDIRAATSN